MFGIVPRQVIGGWSKSWIEREGFFVIRHGLLGLVLEIMQHAQKHIWRQQVGLGFEYRFVLLHRLGIGFVLGVESRQIKIRDQHVFVEGNSLLKSTLCFGIVVLGQVDTAEQVVEEGILWRGVQLGAHPRQRLGGLFFRHVHLY